jgi:Holliday junction resolvase RusA-like endonuclease
MKYEIEIAPMGKPRMVRSDSWKKRPCVTRYWAFKDELNFLCKKAGYGQRNQLFATFHIPMPKSWNKGKRALMLEQNHDQKFDIDNIVKAVLDCLLPDGDEKVHTVCVNKVWSEHPAIVFYDTLPEWMEDL